MTPAASASSTVTASADSPCRNSTTSKSSTSVSARRTNTWASSRSRSSTPRLLMAGWAWVASRRYAGRPGWSVTEGEPAADDVGGESRDRPPGLEGRGPQAGQRVQRRYVELDRDHAGGLMHHQPIGAARFEQMGQVDAVDGFLHHQYRVGREVGG